MESNQERLQRLKTEGVLQKEDIQWLIEQAEKTERYEHVIGAIANIDTIFLNADGSEQPWNDKKAMEVIDDMVIPLWNDICAKSKE